MRCAQIGIIDYGMGNLHSVAKAVAVAGNSAIGVAMETQLVTNPAELAGLDAVILPGVGNFGEAMSRLDAAGLRTPILDYLESGRPFLGICLGLQVLFESSEEAPGCAGLGFFKGTVRRFPDTIAGEKLTVPAMGWNIVRPRAGLEGAFSPDGVSDPRYYFVHSYYVAPEDDTIVAADASYGIEYCAAVARPSLLATQFHPEKSGTQGLAFLRRFLAQTGVPA